MAQSKERNILRKLLSLQALQKQYSHNPYAGVLFPQLIAEEMSYLNMHVESIDTMASMEKENDYADFNIKNYTIAPAKKTLVKLFANANIVMINEAHHVEQHRVFTIDLLHDMWKLGFRYLALENLTEHFEEQIKDTYINKKLGSYSQSTYMGILVLQAKNIGFELIAYDYTASDSFEQREDNAANIIFDKIFKNKPDAKVLIHCGYAHINEQDKLAAKLSVVTGHDPLTVNQTHLQESTAAKEHPIYSVIEKELTEPFPVVLLDKGQKLWSYKPKSYDVNVIWPRMTKGSNRQIWGKLNRKVHTVNANICIDYPCLIESFVAQQDTKSIVQPQDRVVVWHKEDNVELFYSDKSFIKVSDLSHEFWVPSEFKL
jgi:hypothetical protein